MRLDVSKALAAEGSEIPFEGEQALEAMALLGETVAFEAPAGIRGWYEAIGEAVRVRGTLDFTARSRCVRCLRTCDKPFSVPFDAEFVLTPNPDNPDLYVYEGAWVDLTDAAGDAAALALPMRWLCREDCRGLCPVCGADRNEQACSCRSEEPSRRPLEALQWTEDESEV